MKVLTFTSAVVVINQALLVLLVPLVVSGQSFDSRSLVPASYLSLSEQQTSVSYAEVVRHRSQVFSPLAFDSLAEKVKVLGRGGDVSGGGTSALRNGKRFLIDLGPRESASSKLIIPEAMKFEKRSLQRVDFSATTLNNLILEMLQPLSEPYPELKSALLAVYQNVPFYFGPGRFRIFDLNFYLKPQRYSLDDVFSTVGFNIKGLGVLVSMDQFMEMDGLNQSAFVVHELVRSLQIQHGLKLTNDQIQEFVYALVNRTDLKTIIETSPLKFFDGKLKPEDQLYVKYRELSLETSKVVPSLEAIALNSARFKNYFELADASAELSSLLLTVKINNTSLQPSSMAAVARLESELDRLAVAARSSGVEVLGVKAVSAATELKSVQWRQQSRFLTECERSSFNGKNCQELFARLRILIR